MSALFSRIGTSPSVLAVASLLVLGLLHGAAVEGSCVGSMSNTAQSGDLLLVTGIGAGDIDTAISYWMSCSGYDSGFPALTSDPGAGTIDQWIGVQYHQGQSSSNCGSYDPDTKTIHLYDKGMTAQGSLYNCNQTDTLAHELGHVLGLANSGCSGYLMGPSPLYQQNGELYADTRAPQTTECDQANMNWLTEHEKVTIDDPKGDETCAK